MSVDLGSGRTMVVDYYCLRDGHPGEAEQGGHLRTWDLQGCVVAVAQHGTVWCCVVYVEQGGVMWRVAVLAFGVHLCSDAPCFAVVRRAVVRCDAVLHLCCVMLCSAVQCYAVLRRAVSRCGVVWCGMA